MMRDSRLSVFPLLSAQGSGMEPRSVSNAFSPTEAEDIVTLLSQRVHHDAGRSFEVEQRLREKLAPLTQALKATCIAPLQIGVL